MIPPLQEAVYCYRMFVLHLSRDNFENKTKYKTVKCKKSVKSVLVCKLWNHRKWQTDAGFCIVNVH